MQRTGRPDVLSQRALNRATLARQLLLQRSSLGIIDAIEHLVGLQGQVPNAPYLGLWSRLEGFRFEALTRLIEQKKVVRAALLRGTLHLTSARDLLALRMLFQPLLARALQTTRGRLLDGLDLDEVCAAARALMAERPRTYAELAEALRERWPRRDGAAMAQVPRHLEALVQVPQAGTWNWTKPAPVTTAEFWLGRAPKAAGAPDALLKRYLAAFGPASAQDMATWSGMTGLREAIERLRPRLKVFHDERGVELFDLPEAPRPDPDTPAPPRLVAPYDNLLLAFADRTRVLDDAHRARVATVNGQFHPTVLIDGRVQGLWKLEEAKDGSAAVRIEPFGSFAKADKAALETLALQLLETAAPQATAHDVRFVAAARG